jgi:hypothetical protein
LDKSRSPVEFFIKLKVHEFFIEELLFKKSLGGEIGGKQIKVFKANYKKYS